MLAPGGSDDVAEAIPGCAKPWPAAGRTRLVVGLLRLARAGPQIEVTQPTVCTTGAATRARGPAVGSADFMVVAGVQR